MGTNGSDIFPSKNLDNDFVCSINGGDLGYEMLEAVECSEVSFDFSFVEELLFEFLFEFLKLFIHRNFMKVYVSYLLHQNLLCQSKLLEFPFWI